MEKCCLLKKEAWSTFQVKIDEVYEVRRKSTYYVNHVRHLGPGRGTEMEMEVGSGWMDQT